VAERVYPPIIAVARGLFTGLGIRFTIDGAEHIPTTGGALLAGNHVSYLDFMFVGLAARPAGRLVRFMAKKSTFTNPVSGPLMRGMHHIPVDRAAGADAFRAGVEALRDGELVGIFPEATISRSFAVKDFKTGAARMALQSGVPLVPIALWGGQRIYTKGRRPSLTRGRAVSVAVGEPFTPPAGSDPRDVTADLRARVTALVAGLEAGYPQNPPAGTDPAELWWLPADAGGSAPTPDQAAALDAVDADRRKRRR
jgi:1-acyl-sn-glycerol-3-phosphate acyltransferase